VLINYDLLKMLVEVTRGPSFAAAAARLEVTPSAISQQIKLLEGQLGMKLFVRDGRQLWTMDDVETLAAQLAEHFAAIDEAVEQCKDLSGQVRGTVRIGIPASIARSWLRPRLARVLRAHADLVVETHFDVPSVLVRRLLEGRDDLSILLLPVDAPALETRIVGAEELVAVASPAYLAKQASASTASELGALSWIVFDADLAMHTAWWRGSFAETEPLPSRVVCRVPSLDEMMALARLGIGATVLPRDFVADALAANELAALTPEGDRRPTPTPMHLAWRRTSLATTRVLAARDSLLALDL
jgi:DNA-binding transcriptional LysR family regulator